MAAPTKKLTYTAKSTILLAMDGPAKTRLLYMTKQRAADQAANIGMMLNSLTRFATKRLLYMSSAEHPLVQDASTKARIIYMSKRRVLVGNLTSERTQTFPPPYQPRPKSRPSFGQQWPRLVRSGF